MNNPVVLCAQTQEAQLFNMPLPSQAKDGDAGYDLHCVSWYHDTNTGMNIINTGAIVVIPYGYCGLVFPRGSTVMRGWFVPTVVIDSNYQDYIRVGVYNHERTAIEFERGQRVAQLVLTPHIYGAMIPALITELPPTVRGTQWNGSSGGTGKQTDDE